MFKGDRVITVGIGRSYCQVLLVASDYSTQKVLGSIPSWAPIVYCLFTVSMFFSI